MDKANCTPSLYNRNFLLLFHGQLVSQLGGACYFLVMAFWIKEYTESATLFAMVGVATMLPSILLGPVGATFADRYPRKYIVVICDFIEGFWPIVIGGAMLLYGHDIQLIVPLLFIYGITSGVVKSFFNPAIQAMVPDLVSTDKLVRANGAMNGIRSFSMMAGQSLAGLLLAFFQIPYLMFAIGIAFIISAISEIFIKNEKNIISTPELLDRNSFKKQLIDGVKYFKSIQGLSQATFVFAAYLFIMSFVTIALPYHIDVQLNLDGSWYGYLLACSGIGMLLGNFMAAIPMIRTLPKIPSYIFLLIIAAISLACLSYTTSSYIAILVQITRGIAFGIISTWLPTSVQLAGPEKFRGRVVGLFTTLTIACTPLGFIMSGLLVDGFNHNTQIILASVSILLAAMAVYVASNKNLKAFVENKNPAFD